MNDNKDINIIHNIIIIDRYIYMYKICKRFHSMSSKIFLIILKKYIIEIHDNNL